MENASALTVKHMVRFEDSGNVRAICDLHFADALLIRGLRVVDGQKGRFVSMPRAKGKQGWFDLVSPLSRELRQVIESTVLKAYEKQQPAVEETAGSAINDA